jgi:glyoxylase-like metal-dependent hydrolase (beta-lactamase superfamily II)
MSYEATPGAASGAVAGAPVEENGAPLEEKRTSAQLSERVHAVLGGVNCAIVDVGDGRALLVDSGQDKEYGRKVRKALDALGLELTLIVATHSHADHYGGNAYLLRQFPEARVWAPEIEADVIRTPALEPIYLFHGAKPLPELTSKWLQADASPVHRVVAAGDELCGAVGFRLLDVRGHAHRQLAVLVDDVLLAADAVFGAETLEKYPIPFAQDVAGQLAAFETVAGVSARVLLPGHGAPTEDLAGVAESNRRAVLRAADAILAACAAPGARPGTSMEDVVAGSAETLGVMLDDLARYHLNYCVVSAHLGRLRELGLVACGVEARRLVWRRTA